MFVEESRQEDTARNIAELVRQELAPHYSEMAQFHSTAALERSPLYRAKAEVIERVFNTPHSGDFRRKEAPVKSRYRFLAWNIERGAQLDAQIAALQSHPYLKECDVLLLTETDIGMARSGNRNVAREIAEALGCQYAFIPCYISLVKGSGVEYYTEGQNQLGLHGDAIVSKYPLRRIRSIPLPNGVDKMAGREKRLGFPHVIVADVDLPGLPVTAAAVHLDAQSTQRHRQTQMEVVLRNLNTTLPVILGGDWNTTTYNSSAAFPAIMGFWLRVMMGVDHVIRNHYLHPYRHFEKGLFDLLKRHQFDYELCNRPGDHTISYDVEDIRARESLGEWVPWWCFAFMKWALRNHGGRCPLKIDWFATRGLECESPEVLHEFREGRRVPLSDHDPIGVDLIRR